MTHPNLIERLNPCPFCGGADVFVERADYSSCYVICNDCGTRGPTSCNENDEDCAAEEAGMEPGENAARRLWNIRTNDQAISTLTAEVEELRDGLNRAHYCLIILNSHTPADIRENVNQAKAIIDATLTKGEGDKP